MKTEDRLWMLAIMLMACVIGIVVVLGVIEYYEVVDATTTQRMERAQQRESADRSIQRAEQSLTRMEQLVGDIQMQTLRTHILLLERSLEQCCPDEVEPCQYESLFLDPIEE